MWSIFATCTAVVCSSLFVSSVTNNMAEMARQRQSRNTKLAIVRKYAQKYGISTKLDMQLKQYIATNYAQHLHDVVEAEFIKILPTHLLVELRVQMWAPILLAHPFFEQLHFEHSRTELDLCSRALAEVKAFESEVVFSVGEACNKMYFITAGTLIYTHNSRLRAQDKCGMSSWTLGSTDDSESLMRGTWLCEAALWVVWQNQGDAVVARDGGYVTVAADEFANVVQEHGSSLNDTLNYARLYTETMNADSKKVSDLSMWASTLTDDVGSSQKADSTGGAWGLGSHALASLRIVPHRSESRTRTA